MIILDTNVVSELMRSEPAPSVASWVRDRDRRELRTSAVTLAEVRYGIARLPDGRRKQILLAAADEIFSALPTRSCRSIPRPRNITQSLLAAANGPGNQSRASTR